MLAGVVAVGSLGGHYLATGTDAATQALDWLGYVLLALGALSLAARRHATLAVLGITATAVTVTFVLDIDHNGPFVILPVMVALYTASESGRRTAAVATAAAVVAALGLLVLGFGARADAGDTQGLLWATGRLAASVVTGEVVRGRRDYLREVETRAVDAERTRDEEGRRRVVEERLRIARELHDVLGHSLSLINVQAGTAAHVIDRQPDQARDALETIRQASKHALTELRGTRAEDDIAVVGEASGGREAVELAAELRPDVVLMDIRMPELDGIEAARRIASDSSLDDVRVVMLTTFEMDEYVFEALRGGASGFLLKDTEPVELLRAVRVVAGGESLLAPSVTRRLIAEFAARSPGRRSPPQLDRLTDREREVMALVAAGLSNDEIAERLVVSPATAKTHVSRAMVKLHARDRAQLVVFAYESGLVRAT